MKIFLVEDSQVVRERLRGTLACIPDIELVAEVDNEDDAIQGICAVLPDVVILDLTLVGGSGMEVLRRIRLQPLSMLVIVLTNHPQYQKKCLELGANYFLDKTKEISVLEELLTQLAGTFKNSSLALPTSLNPEPNSFRENDIQSITKTAEQNRKLNLFN